MDEAFFLRARRLLDERQRQQLDHDDFVRAVSARQAVTPTAMASLQAPAVEARPAAGGLAALLLADASWRMAASGQAGCFNRAAARRPVNTR